MSDGSGSTSSEVDRLRKRLERERRIRQEAEAIAERATGDLYASLQDLGRLNEELAGANQAIRDFVSVASHDLRGPLAAINGFVQLMQQKWGDFDDGRRLEFLDIIGKQGGHLNRLVEDLLCISKIETGGIEARIEDIYIDRALDEAVQSLGASASAVTVAHSADEVRILADPDHVSRIVQNYLTNAVKYGGPPIAATCHANGGFAEVHVCDNGRGVPEEFVPRLFEKFARAEDAVTREHEGTGLGLSIVRGLARANGGDAWYEPNQPHGSCFAVRFPKAS
jgi:signal transduction histidine kinase